MSQAIAVSATLELLRHRASVRAFTPDPVPGSLIDDLICAAVRIPTSFNLQAYALIVLTEPQRVARLSELCGQAHVAKAPAVVVICADLDRVSRLGRALCEPVDLAQDDIRLTAIIDASLVGASLSLAAESVGLGTVMLGAVRNRPHDVAELLRLPRDAMALFGVCLGWPQGTPRCRPRLRSDLVTHEQVYQPERADAALEMTECTLSHPDGQVSDEEIANWRVQHVRGLRRAGERAGAREVNHVPNIRPRQT